MGGQCVTREDEMDGVIDGNDVTDPPTLVASVEEILFSGIMLTVSSDTMGV